jgi:hypothetical protein
VSFSVLTEEIAEMFVERVLVYIWQSKSPEESKPLHPPDRVDGQMMRYSTERSYTECFRIHIHSPIRISRSAFDLPVFADLRSQQRHLHFHKILSFRFFDWPEDFHAHPLSSQRVSERSTSMSQSISIIDIVSAVWQKDFKIYFNTSLIIFTN